MVTSAKQYLDKFKGSFKGSFKVLGATAIAATVGLTSAMAYAQSRNTIEIDGSSTVFPLTEAVAEEFMTSNRNVDIAIGVSGTGGGFEKFCAGETVISNASRKIKDSEKELCAAAGIEYVELPVAIDAITVVVNPANTWAKTLTTEQLKTIWEPAAEGTITRWNQVDPSFPNEPIDLFGPGTDSGTFDYFTKEIVGEEGSSRGDYTASEDDNVLVLGISRDDNALGYFGYSYYLENADKLTAVGIASEDTNGRPVVPSAETMADYKPLARTVYIYASKQALASRSEVSSFVEAYLNSAETLASDTGFVALPASDYAAALAKL
jgi:phosphate transport system substrate-binding protein